MQPCSHPRYGFKLVSKPTSGLVFRVMIVLVPSRKYCVGRRGVFVLSRPTSTTSASAKSTCSVSKRFAGLQDAPRPRIATRLWGDSSTTETNFRRAMRECSFEHAHCPAIFEPENAERPTLNVERSIIFCIQCWTLDVGRWTLPIHSRRGGRVVDRAGLENRKAERPREFESHPLRFLDYQGLMQTASQNTTLRHNKYTEIHPCLPVSRVCAGKRQELSRTDPCVVRIFSTPVSFVER